MTESSVFNIGEICRGCLSDKKDNLRSIFDSNILQTFISCTNVQVTEKDGLPKLICSSCVYKVISWVTFKTQCQQSDDILKTTFHCPDNKMPTALGDEKSSPQQQHETVEVESFSEVEDSHHDCTTSDDVTVERLSGNVALNERLQVTQEENIHEDEDILGDDEIIFESSDESDADTSINVNVIDPPKTVDLKIKSTSNSSQQVTCNECKKTFRNLDRLISHQRGEHEGKKPEVCPICEKEFNNLRALRRHRLKHSDVKQFRCNECGKMYKYQTSLTLHKKGHANVRRFVCDLCGKSFVRAHGLQSHLLSHSTLTPFSCDYNECGKQFKNAIMLRNHQKRHEGIKTFVCSECGKEFITSAELSTHIRSHTGFKPFACSMCDKSYKTKSHLSVHYRSHSGARPYACDICPLTFAHNKVLKHHRLVHLGELPWVCDICQRPFRQRSTLMKHKKLHDYGGKGRNQQAQQVGNPEFTQSIHTSMELEHLEK